MTNSDGANFDQQFKHQTTEIKGVRIHYVIGGKGEAVVLLHGFPQTWYEWHKVMPALAAKYTVIDTTEETGNYWHTGFHMTPNLPEQLVMGK